MTAPAPRDVAVSGCFECPFCVRSGRHAREEFMCAIGRLGVYPPTPVTLADGKPNQQRAAGCPLVEIGPVTVRAA